MKDDARSEMIRRLRLGNLRTLFRYRYGPILPDDDAGREDLKELLLPISVGPNAAIKMPNVIEVWAPWMRQDEARELIDHINQTPISNRKPNAKVLGGRLNVTNELRDRLGLWTMAACDMTADEASEHRRAKARERRRRYRQRHGARSRTEYEANSANRTKPWIALGMSRSTWYREQRPETETSASRSNTSVGCDTPVSPERASPPQGGHGVRVQKKEPGTESQNEARGQRIRLAS